MAKKKPKPKSSGSKSQAGGPLPDWRVIEGVMQKAIAPLDGRRNADDVAAQAQELMYAAFEAPPSEQAKLARKALEIWPDCADALVLLAQRSDNLESATEFYERGVAAGRRALGREFDQLAGHFWGFIETRPYMRARLGLAQCLSETGRRDAAAEHYRDMLRLNPNDNQAIRELLAGLLFELNRDEELGELLERYREDAGAAWVYSRVLFAFRQLGDCAESRQVLATARK